MSTRLPLTLTLSPEGRGDRFSFPRVVLNLRRLLLFQIIQQVHVIRVVQLEPIRNRRRGHAATLGERGDDSDAQLRVGDLADADHAVLTTWPSGGGKGSAAAAGRT